MRRLAIGLGIFTLLAGPYFMGLAGFVVSLLVATLLFASLRRMIKSVEKPLPSRRSGRDTRIVSVSMETTVGNVGDVKD